MSLPDKDCSRSGLQKVCCASAGEWICGTEGEWNFVLDKGRLGRLVSINEKSTLSELCNRVISSFGAVNVEASLSYFNTRFGSTDVGSRMPPFLIESDCGVRNFFKMLVDRMDRNLLVSFKNVGADSMLKTPVSCPIGSRTTSVGGSNRTGKGKVGSCIPGEDLFWDENGLVEEVEALEEELRSNVKSDVEGGSFKTPVIPNKRKSGMSIGESSFDEAAIRCAQGKRKSAFPNTPIEFDDSGFLEEVEVCEERHRSTGKTFPLSENTAFVGGSGSIPETSKRQGERVPIRSHPSFNLLDDDDSSEEGVEVPIVGDDVNSKGYDTEFWQPLVDNMYGGSDAVEIFCNTNSVFDHYVRGGDGDRKQYAKEEQVRYERNPNSMFSGQSSNSGSGQRGDTFLKRNLSDVLDEEFDVEPLFDDTLYESYEIPDLDREESEEVIYVGKTFRNKLDCQISLAIHAIKNMFYFRQTRSNRDYIVLNCADVLCGWRVSAYEMKDCGYYQIRKASLEHVCSIETRSQYTKLASSKVIAAMYRSKFINKDSGPKPMDLQQLLLEDLRVSCSYTKCWKARESANEENNGLEEESYANLEKYLHMLKLANPGTIADIETEDDGCCGERFLYLFLAFGASIAGFRHLRRVLVIDGTHLSGKYKGVLLTASGQDANFQIFPLAFAIVDSENEDSWTWFLRKVEGILGNSATVAIISDRANSILKAVKEVYPDAKHGACIVHLSRNVVTKFKSKGLAKIVTKAACAHTVKQFKLHFDDISNKSPECARYLRNGGIGSWARVYFAGQRYNMMTSNIAESLNNALRKARSSPIIELVMYIQSLMTRWFGARRVKAEAHRGYVTPQVDKVITNNLEHAKGSKVTLISDWRYEVIGQFGERNISDLKDKKCSCKVYDNIQIPCGHALIAGGVLGLDYGKLCSHYYTSAVWRNTYAGVVQSHDDPMEVDIPDTILDRVIKPPRTRRPSGRPKQKRIASTGEFSSGSRVKLSNNRCGRCGGVGHNKTSCKNPI